MSFTWFADKPLRTREQVAAEVHVVSLARGLDRLATVLTCMGIEIEVGADPHRKGYNEWWCPANPTKWNASMAFPHDSESDDGRSSGYLQQQPGPAPDFAPWWGTTEDMMTLSRAVNTFQDRLPDDYGRAAGNAVVAGQIVQGVQGSSFPDRYQAAWATANEVVDRALNGGVTPADPAPPPILAPTPVDEPDFVETNLIGVSRISANSQSRNGQQIRFGLGHTTEGSGGMDLVNYMIGARVSYHYLIDNDEDGNTVFDLVDTDRAAWAVGDANNYTINYVIGRSTVEWTRDQWLAKARKAIRIMAWLMIQDAVKYGYDPRVIAPPYDASIKTGLSDHRYVTKVIGWGSHSDMDGPNGPYGPPFVHFPWDVLISDVAELTGKVATMAGQLSDTELSKLFASRSPYRDTDATIDTAVGFILNTNRDSHVNFVDTHALAGVPWAVDQVTKLASGDESLPGVWLWYKDKNGKKIKDQWAIDNANDVLAKIPAAAKRASVKRLAT